MKYLITGGCGFLGANIVNTILDRDYGEVFLYDNFSRIGSAQNLEWLNSRGKLGLYRADIRNANDVAESVKAVRPDVVIHLAGQVAMTTSIKSPRMDFETNAVGTLNVLEAVRQFAPEAIVIYSSTNKVYGDLEWVKYQENDTRYVATDFPNGFSESTPMEFHSPYGCSKGAADQYMLDYYRTYGTQTVVFRHSSMYGDRQFATYDQGWVGWFCELAVKIKNGKLTDPITIHGNGKQVRDVIHSRDVTSLYLKTIEHIQDAKGKVFNVGGGKENSLSLLELFGLLENALGIKIRIFCEPVRASDQKVFIADIRLASETFHWNVMVDKLNGIQQMLQWVIKNA